MNKITKKILAFALLALPMTFVSCSSDDEIPSTGDVVNASAEAKGTYAGTWYVAEGADGTPVEYSGSLTISEYGENMPYACYVTVACPDYTAIEGTGAANVMKKAYSYGFFNEIETNGMGTVFQGEIGFDGKATMSFKKSIKVGRKTYTYYITFDGSKQ